MITINADGGITGYQVTLKAITEADLEQIRQWRNSDFVRNKMISTERIEIEQQRAWFKKIQQDNTQLHWLIEYKNESIGVTNVRTVVKGQTVESAPMLEPGLYIGHERYHGNLIAFSPTLVMYDYCFAHFNVTQFKAIVKADNTAALKYNQQLGYEIICQGKYYELRLQRDAYERHTEKLKQLLSRQRKQKI